MTAQMKLEKINAAAERMGISRESLYREVKEGRLTIVKIGKRASAVESAQVDAWISSKMKGKTPQKCAAPKQENTEIEDPLTLLDGFEDTEDLVRELYDIAHSPEIGLTAIEKETVMEARDSLIGLFTLCKKLIRRNKTFNAEITGSALLRSPG